MYPAAERKQSREETLSELFNLVSKNYCEPYRPKSVEDYMRLFKTHLAPVRSRRLSEITRADVQVLHAKIGKVSGIYAANKSLRVLSLLFKKANAAQRITKFRERSCDRFLRASELSRFFEALQEEKNGTLRDFIMIALLRGARRG